MLQLNNITMNEKVKADDLVQITGTGENSFLPLGTTKIVHKVAADNLIARGFATLGDELVKPNKKSGKGKSKSLEV